MATRFAASCASQRRRRRWHWPHRERRSWRAIWTILAPSPRRWRGARAVFSVQLPPTIDPDSERRQAGTLIRCALAAGVEQFVQSSVASTGWRDRIAAIADERTIYWDSKEAVEQAVRDAAFAHRCILQPVAIMENFLPPAATYMYPDLGAGELRVAVDPGVRVAMIAADDIGAAAATAFAAPERFVGAIELAGDRRTYGEIAALLGAALGRRIDYHHVSAHELRARGAPAGWIASQLWLNQFPDRGNPEEMTKLGIAATSFAAWTKAHARRLAQAYP